MTFRGTDPESCITEYTLVYQNKTNVNNPRRTGGKSKCPDAATETMRLTHCNGLGCRFDVFFAGEWGTVSASPAAERIWHTYDSQGQIMALPFRSKASQRLKLFPLRSEAAFGRKETIRLTHCNGLGCRLDVFFAKRRWGTVCHQTPPAKLVASKALLF